MRMLITSLGSEFASAIFADRNLKSEFCKTPLVSKTEKYDQYDFPKGYGRLSGMTGMVLKGLEIRLASSATFPL